MDLFEHVGQRIRELRVAYGEGRGLSQESLAQRLGVSANTISRWETATYKPTLEDLDKLARFFGRSILEFLPSEERDREDEGMTALLRTAKVLPPEDLAELRRYAEYRKARNLLQDSQNRRSKRK